MQGLSFTCPFFVRIFRQSQNVTRKSYQKRLLYKKRVHLTLMKLNTERVHHFNKYAKLINRFKRVRFCWEISYTSLSEATVIFALAWSTWEISIGGEQSDFKITSNENFFISWIWTSLTWLCLAMVVWF